MTRRSITRSAQLSDIGVLNFPRIQTPKRALLANHSFENYSSALRYALQYESGISEGERTTEGPPFCWMDADSCGLEFKFVGNTGTARPILKWGRGGGANSIAQV